MRLLETVSALVENLSASVLRLRAELHDAEKALRQAQRLRQTLDPTRATEHSAGRAGPSSFKTLIHAVRKALVSAGEDGLRISELYSLVRRDSTDADRDAWGRHAESAKMLGRFVYRQQKAIGCHSIIGGRYSRWVLDAPQNGEKT